MTTVEFSFTTPTPPTEAVTFALANTREVYGIRRLKFDRAARTLRVEYDATRLNAAAVTKLVRQAGLDIDEELSADPAAARSGTSARSLTRADCAAPGIPDNLTKVPFGITVCARSSAG